MVHRSSVNYTHKAGLMAQVVMKAHVGVQKVMLAWCVAVDQQWREDGRKAQIMGYRRVSDEQAPHPLSTEIVTVLSHHTIGMGPDYINSEISRTMRHNSIAVICQGCS